MGEVTISNILEFLDDNGVVYLQDELTYLFKKFDHDRDGRVGFQEFLNILL
jgi:Ca2+-binding EF-hand superfamily protein